MELLKDKGWQLGAENSGHIINLKHTSTGDGIIAALNVLQAVCEQSVTLRPKRGHDNVATGIG
jgi:phosphoglucosamine mutase